MKLCGELLKFGSDVVCDYCGGKKPTARTHYSSTNYARFVCVDCAYKLKRYDVNMKFDNFTEDEIVYEQYLKGNVSYDEYLEVCEIEECEPMPRKVI